MYFNQIKTNIKKNRDVYTFEGLEQNIDKAIGGYHVMVESLAGYLYTWGHNEMGQLGVGISKGTSQNEFNEPCCQLPTLVNDTKDIFIKSMSAGWGNSAFVSYDGKLSFVSLTRVGN